MMNQPPPSNMSPAPPPSYNSNGSALLTAITPLLHNLAAQSNPDSELFRNFNTSLTFISAVEP